MAFDTENKGTSRGRRRGSGSSAKSGKPRGGGTRDRKARQPMPPRSPFEIVQAAFYACARCSHFLAGYRALHGLEQLQAAADAGDTTWLELTWDADTRELVQRSFGGHTDASLFHYSVSCPECHRIYLYHEAEAGETTFQVEVQPRARR